MTSSFAFQASTQILTRNRIGQFLSESTLRGGFRKVHFSGTGSTGSVWTVGPNTQDLCSLTKKSAECGWGLKQNNGKLGIEFND